MARKSRRRERAAANRAAEQTAPSLTVAAPPSETRLSLLIIGGLVIAVFIIYAQVRTHAFIDFDDNLYITQNEHVLHGLRWPDVVWAFTHVHAANWHPLTWISHMIDVQLFGLNAGAHLLVSAALHAINSVLVFLFLRLATGALYRSATVAAFFAVHPLHVESVAWVSERKDTLSTLFFLLCLLAYAEYALKASRRAYGASVIALALGLLAKPMLVTAPFVLLLLDYWPFHRLEMGNLKRRILEKVPFALCIVPSIMATLFAQKESMARPGVVPLLARLANAATSYAAYVGKTFWPVDLIVLYPLPTRIDPFLAPLCAFGVIAATIGAFRVRESLPWLFVGWCWFVGMLVPVIGLVQVGQQVMADRYTYLPHIGLFMAVVWTVAHLAQKVNHVRAALPVVTGLAIVLLAAVAHAQVRYWAGSIPLFEHALKIAPDNNRPAHVILGAGLLDIGAYGDAEREYRQALGFEPAEKVYIGLSAAFSGQGKLAAAAEAARLAVAANPQNADANTALGTVELARGNMKVAEGALARSAQLKNDPRVTALLMVARGQLDNARKAFAEAIRQDPRDAEQHNSLATILTQRGDLSQALEEYSIALRLDPNQYDAHLNYGTLLSHVGRDAEAEQQFLDAARIRPRSPEPHVCLGLLEDRRHHFDVAAREIEQAIAADHDLSNRYLIQLIGVPTSPTAIDEYLTYLRGQSGH